MQSNKWLTAQAAALQTIPCCALPTLCLMMACSQILLPLHLMAVMQRGGLGQIRGSKQQQPEEAEDDDAPSQNPFAGLFGGTKKVKVRVCSTFIRHHSQMAVKSDVLWVNCLHWCSTSPVPYTYSSISRCQVMLFCT